VHTIFICIFDPNCYPMDDKRKASVDFALKASWLSIAKLYNLIGAHEEVTHSTGFVLLNIDRQEGTPATKIAPLMGMEARSLTRMLKSLEEKGWITREADSRDRRKAIIRLTELGKEKRAFSRLAVKEFNRRIQERLSPEQLEVFFGAIEDVQDVVDEYLSDFERGNIDIPTAQELLAQERAEREKRNTEGE